MNPNDQPEERSDSWDLLARELLGEETDPNERSEPPDATEAEEAATDAAPLSEDEEVEAVPQSDQSDEAPPLQPIEPLGEEETVAEELPGEATREADESLGAELQVETEPPTPAPADETEEAESPSDKPRRPRRGRRRRSRRASEEAGKTTEQPEPLDESEFDAQFESINDGEDDDGEDDDGSSAKSDAKSKAIPTWAEAISYLSRGPEEGSAKNTGSRPRRRRRRGKPPQK